MQSQYDNLIFYLAIILGFKKKCFFFFYNTNFNKENTAESWLWDHIEGGSDFQGGGCYPVEDEVSEFGACWEVLCQVCMFT